MAPYGRRRRAWRTRCARAVRSIRRSAPKGRDGPATAAVPTRSATSPRRVPAPGGALLRRRFPAFPGDPARPARRLVAVGIAGPGVPDARVRFPPIRRSVPKRRDGPATAAVPTRSATSPRRIRAPGGALLRRRFPAFPGDPARPTRRLMAVGAGRGVPDARVRFAPFVGTHRRGAMDPQPRRCRNASRPWWCAPTGAWRVVDAGRVRCVPGEPGTYAGHGRRGRHPGRAGQTRRRQA
jgi:hypothetical protein